MTKHRWVRTTGLERFKWAACGKVFDSQSLGGVEKTWKRFAIDDEAVTCVRCIKASTHAA